MNYPAAELRGIKMNFYLINPDAEHRGILLIKRMFDFPSIDFEIFPFARAPLSWHSTVS